VSFVIDTRRFSVLMSIYKGENPAYLDSCLKSLHFQTLKPEEIILVEDGPLTCQLHEIISKWSNKIPIKKYPLKKNLGLAQALNYGLKYCSYDLVARMDTDDICKPQRFEIQINYFKNNPNLTALGSSIEEFEKDPQQSYGLRKVPTNHLDIIEYSKSRNPINHMTVMFNKHDILNVGGYGDYRYSQDYFLWVILLNKGKEIENLSESLVYARTNPDLFRRRGGWKYLMYEMDMQTKFLQMGHITISKYLTNLGIRVFIRLCPTFLREKIYKFFLRN
jgi:glycosyltransferase involved in cell wall biosynthesis